MKPRVTRKALSGLSHRNRSVIGPLPTGGTLFSNTQRSSGGQASLAMTA